jgi:hypothetical protein
MSYNTWIDIDRLTPAALDTKIRGSRIYKKTTGWDPLRTRHGVVFDLSKCTVVDLAGTAQLLTLIERACLDGIATEVVLPALGVLQSELDAWERLLAQGTRIELTLQRELTARHYARTLLERYGFEAALKLTHIAGAQRLVTVRNTRMLVAPYGALTVTLRRLISALEDARASTIEEVDRDQFVPTELRFRWIDRLARNELTTLVQELERVLSQGQEGLNQADARSIASTIVYEALDNVRLHAHPAMGAPAPKGAALLGAAFVMSPYLQEADRPISRQLHVVLADSGVGLIRTLAPTFDPTTHDRLLPAAVRAWDRDAKTIVWAFHPLSTSRDIEPGEPPVRGLSRSRYQLRFNRGSIRVRTETLEVTILEPPDTLDAHYTTNRTAALPGTLLDVRLLASKEVGDDQSVAADEISSGAPIVPVLVHAESPNAEETLSIETVDVPHDEVVCIIIRGLDFSRDGGHRAASLVARLCSIVAGHMTVCVLPETPSGLIFSVLHSLTEHREHSAILADESPGATMAELPDEPVLVLGSDRRVTWWGPLHGRELALVQHAARAGFAGPSSQLDADETPTALANSTTPGALRRWVAGGHLAITASRLEAALAKWLDEELHRVLLRAAPGIRPGDALLDNLQPVSRVIDLRHALTSLGLAQLAGQIGGAPCRRALTNRISLLVSLPDVPSQFVDSFATAAGYDGRRIELNPHRDLWRLGPPPEHRPGKAVILAGITKRAESLRAVAEALLRWGIEPQLVLIIADVRPIPALPIRAVDIDIPVFTLATPTLPDVTTPYKDLLRVREEVETRRDSAYPIPPAKFGRLLEHQGDGFALVHVERSEERHLVGYYDLRAAFADDTFLAEIASHVTALIHQLTPDIANTSHVVVYPADDENRAAILAADVASRLPNSATRALRREPQFEHSDDLWAADAVASFVDWGVVTARTARRALYELAQAGARHVNFVAVASQLDVEAEQHLMAQGSVYGRRLEKEPDQLLPRVIPCPVTVGFRPITRIASTAYSRATCPLCRAVTDFAGYAEECPTEFLRRLARGKVEALQARSRDEALSLSTDLYGDWLGYAERSNLIRLWSLMDRARRSAVARDELRELLSDETDPDRDLTAASLCRISAIRHDLLHSPPLSESEYRRLIVTLALPILVGQAGVGYVALPLKRQAAITLRVASKERFVESLPQIVENNLRSRTVVGELLIGVYSLMRRPYQHRPGLMQALVKSLEKVDALVSEGYRAGRTDRDVVQSVHSIRRFATTIQIRDTALTDHTAWAALRGAYRDDIREHHHAINRMAQASRRLNDLATTRALQSGRPEDLLTVLQRVEASWNVCADFLASDVLPYLRQLRDVLSAKYYQEQAGNPAVWQRWSDLLMTEVTENDMGFARLLRRLVLDPSEFTDGTRSDLREEIAWLESIFLGVRRVAVTASSDAKRDTLLLRWLGECPSALARLRDYLDAEFAELGVDCRPIVVSGETLRSAENVAVFMPDGLMREIASTLVDNVNEHGDLPRTRVELEVHVAVTDIEVVLRSVGTARGGADALERSRGLAGLAGRIAPFGALVEPKVAGESFETVLHVARWSGIAP